MLCTSKLKHLAEICFPYPSKNLVWYLQFVAIKSAPIAGRSNNKLCKRMRCAFARLGIHKRLTVAVRCGVFNDPHEVRHREFSELLAFLSGARAGVAHHAGCR